MRDQANTSACKTRSREGYVYFIQSVNGGPVKIGFAKDPLHRLGILQIGHPDELVLRHIIPGPFSLENELHRRYKACRLRGEWFEPTAEMAEHGRVMFEGKMLEPLFAFGAMSEAHQIHDDRAAAGYRSFLKRRYGLDHVPEPWLLDKFSRPDAVPPRVEVNTAEPEPGEAWSSDLL